MELTFKASAIDRLPYFIIVVVIVIIIIILYWDIFQTPKNVGSL